jgi:tetratricopeptide (TPR) repeat protein
MPDDSTNGCRTSTGRTNDEAIGTKQELAAELNLLLLAAERRAGGRGALKRAALARRVGVSVSSLYAYLDGTTLPPAPTFERLLDALEVCGAQRGRLATARDSLDVRRRFDKQRPPPATVPRVLPPDVHGFTGRAERLVEQHTRALQAARAAGDRAAQAYALGNLGIVNIRRGRYPEAADDLRRSLAISRALHDRAAESVALCHLGVVYGHLGHGAEADACLRGALQISREIGARTLEASALNQLGHAALAGGDPQGGLEYHRRALSAAANVDERVKRAAALRGMGRAYKALDQRDRARTHWERALAIYREVGAPEAEHVLAELSALDRS